MSLRALLTILCWAFVLELFVLVYYLWRGIRPFEFYLNFVLLIVTVLSLVLLVSKERKRRRKDGSE